MTAMPYPSGSFAVGDDLTHGQRQRIDPIAEPRRHLRARRDAYPVLHVPSDGVGPKEAARRRADATELLNDGAAQVARLEAARDRESRLTALIADAARDTGGDPGGMARWLIAKGVRL